MRLARHAFSTVFYVCGARLRRNSICPGPGIPRADLKSPVEQYSFERSGLTKITAAQFSRYSTVCDPCLPAKSLGIAGFILLGYLPVFLYRH